MNRIKISFLSTLFILLAFSVFFSSKSYGQFRSIPSVVTDSFHARFPDAKEVSWKSTLSDFQANFTLNGIRILVKFNSEGYLQELQSKLEMKDLPFEVKDGFNKSKYTGWELRGIMKIKQREEPVLYRFLVKKNSLQRLYLYFSTDGKLMKEATAL